MAENLPNSGSSNLVYFCGPIAEVGAAARGGYQACNRRTIAALRQAGIVVVTLPYPHPTTRGTEKILDYGVGFQQLVYDLFRCKPRSVVHITALYKHFIYIEWLLVMLVRFKRCRIIYDIRAGSMLWHYEQRGWLYRRVFASTLRCADRIMVEGEIYSSLVETLTGRSPVYLPNHVEMPDALSRNRARCTSVAPCMIYVGRVTRDKGIEVALDAVRDLANAGNSCRMLVVGDGDRMYLERLRQQYADCSVDWRGPLPSDQVTAALCDAHFFVFPSRHPGEGHSNALTEAMAMGCVPIASENGFNRSVVGDTGVILPLEATGGSYAEAIHQIWTTSKWEELSKRAATRVTDRFTTSRVVSILTQEYGLLKLQS